MNTSFNYNERHTVKIAFEFNFTYAYNNDTHPALIAYSLVSPRQAIKWRIECQEKLVDNVQDYIKQ